MVICFIYCRKSSESEDRQILSIDSQIRELQELARGRGIQIVEVLTESKSAKAPGRPVFKSMMDRLNRGEADGVICWKLDRLARNPVDGGAVIWAMKKPGIQIITPSETFAPDNENLLLMYLEFGMAQKYIDDLSRNVKRGLRCKAESGWFPGMAPVGYRNVPGLKGACTIEKDQKRFPEIRKCWDMLLGGTSPAEIHRVLCDEWDF